ncbi:MAG: DUF1376 domain-containing protein [Alicyclobacillus sp.]|nr:DUF1376 domain-containing protein [Alicyclobacillus sp.]
MNIPFFSFYPSDWLSDGGVQQLTLEETGAYINLLAYMWTNGRECRIPDDDEFISRILHVSKSKWLAIRKTLIDGPKPVLYVTDGYVHNKRLDEEYRKATEIISKRTKAANKRWSKANGLSDKSESNASALHEQSTCNANELLKECNTDPDTDTDPDPDPDPDTDTDTDTDLKDDDDDDLYSDASKSDVLRDVALAIEAEMKQRTGNPRYMILGDEFQLIRRMVEEGIPKALIVRGVELAFERYKPKYQRDGIRSFAYCKDIIYELWETSQRQTVAGERGGLEVGIHRTSSKVAGVTTQTAAAYIRSQLGKDP